MKQSIDLSFQTPKTILPARQCTQVFILIFLAFVVIAVFMAGLVGIQGMRLSAMTDESQALMMQPQEETLARSVEQKQKVYDELKDKLKGMRQQAALQTHQPFSFFQSMKGLSQSTTQGDWLTGFVFDNSTKTLALEGVVLDPERMHTFIRALKSQSAFEEITLDLMHIHKEGANYHYRLEGVKQP